MRETKVKRNNARLELLGLGGLLPPVPVPPQKTIPKKNPAKAPKEPTRRSTRRVTNKLDSFAGLEDRSVDDGSSASDGSTDGSGSEPIKLTRKASKAKRSTKKAKPKKKATLSKSKAGSKGNKDTLKAKPKRAYMQSEWDGYVITKMTSNQIKDKLKKAEKIDLEKLNKVVMKAILATLHFSISGRKTQLADKLMLIKEGKEGEGKYFV